MVFIWFVVGVSTERFTLILLRSVDLIFVTHSRSDGGGGMRIIGPDLLSCRLVMMRCIIIE